MNKKVFSYALALLLAGSASEAAASPAEDMAQANNKFAFELYSRHKQDSGNIFFSPYSVSSAFAIVCEGARDDTADEIRGVFHLPQDDSLRRNSFLNTMNQLNGRHEGYELRSANALWVYKDYPFLSDYLEISERYYGGKATNLDFVKEPSESLSRINNWVEAQTNGRIKGLLSSDAINKMTRFIITNAVYFKGRWLEGFDVKDTKTKDFAMNPGPGSVKADMMSLTGEKAEFYYAETTGIQVLEIPYKGEDLSMIVLLPAEGAFSSFEESLNAEKFYSFRKSLNKERVDIYIPKFRLEARYMMNDTLRDMGMPSAFSKSADFTGMTDSDKLYISKVIHQAFVEVNEEGTEAAAATAVIMDKAMKMQGAPKVFNANRPFIFMIEQRHTGNILFMGRVKDPSR